VVFLDSPVSLAHFFVFFLFACIFPADMLVKNLTMGFLQKEIALSDNMCCAVVTEFGNFTSESKNPELRQNLLKSK